MKTASGTFFQTHMMVVDKGMTSLTSRTLLELREAVLGEPKELPVPLPALELLKDEVLLRLRLLPLPLPPAPSVSSKTTG